jgi:3-dehydroquinate synthetase
MMGAAHLARIMELIDDDIVRRHRRILELIGLPASAEIDISTLEEAWKRDKKYSKGLRFVLLRAIGRPEAGVLVDHENIAAALERLAS